MDFSPLQSSPALLALAAGILGLAVGSFLNVVIHRLPIMMQAEWRTDCAEFEGREPPPAAQLNLVTPRSRCPSCGTPITAMQNIPLASWVALGGKCAACKAPISVRYPLVELFTGLASAFLAWRFGWGPALGAALVFTWALIAASAIDIDTQLLPDRITLPLLWLGLLVNVTGLFVDLRSAVLGAAGGYLLLWSVYWGFRLLAGKEGMGFGDFKLLAALGAWTGWQTLPLILLVSAGAGAVIGIVVIWLSGKGRDTRIPFGPYLAAGGLVALLWGHGAVVAYLGRFPT
ncbi:MAG TPA: A24 family peptidase [Usitatibacteraceae bacterium]|nr:A24 family peptidase [Usitatibacteraceae bacterium]